MSDAPASALSGRELLDAILAGALPPPPAVTLVGFDIVEVDDGRTVFRFVPDERHYNPVGTVHGGILSTVADTALAPAINSLLPAGVLATTVDLHVSFIRAVTAATGPLTCEGRAEHVGTTLAHGEADIVDASGRLHVRATGTCRVLTTSS
jgi:uncharacterized protein (TIGR00369 family)